MKFSFLMSLVAWVVLFVAVPCSTTPCPGSGSSPLSSGRCRASRPARTRRREPGRLDVGIQGPRVHDAAGAVDIILITVLSTVGAVIYNLVTHLGGGIEVTLKETD